MPRIDTDEWVTSTEAASILTKNSGHRVTDNYVRRLAFTGQIRRKMLHERLSLYNRADVERYTVAKKNPPKKPPASQVLQSAMAVIRSKEAAEHILDMLTVEGKPLKEMLTEQQISEAIEKLQRGLEPWVQEQLAAKPDDEEE